MLNSRVVNRPKERLDFAIYTNVFEPAWERPYNFCYSGTNLNPSRAYTAELLAVRHYAIASVAAPFHLVSC